MTRMSTPSDPSTSASAGTSYGTGSGSSSGTSGQSAASLTSSPRDSRSTSDTAQDTAARIADRLAPATERASEHLHDAVDSAQRHADDFLQAAPRAIGKAAAQMEWVAQRGLDQARHAGQMLSDRGRQARERTLDYVHEAPFKSLLMAMAAGAAVTLLAGWMVRSRARHPHHH